MRTLLSLTVVMAIACAGPTPPSVSGPDVFEGWSSDQVSPIDLLFFDVRDPAELRPVLDVHGGFVEDQALSSVQVRFPDHRLEDTVRLRERLEQEGWSVGLFPLGRPDGGEEMLDVEP